MTTRYFTKKERDWEGVLRFMDNFPINTCIEVISGANIFIANPVQWVRNPVVGINNVPDEIIKNALEACPEIIEVVPNPKTNSEHFVEKSP